jgi:hypothetical protein
MHEMVTFAERVPKLANGTAWKRAEIKRYSFNEVNASKLRLSV